MEEKFLKRAWAEINLDNAAHNFREIKARLNPDTRMCCIVKADAYGHGAERLAQEYEALGADWFAVSNLEEARQLRRAGISLPVLILGYTPPEKAAELAELNISQAAVGSRYAESLSAEARRSGVTVKIHVSLDTGMSRIGFLYQNPERDAASLSEVERICSLPSLAPEGIFTHFSVADEGSDGRDYTRMQFENFTGAIEILKQRGIEFPIRHCANSAAIFDYPEMQLDMVRPGIILYGLMPSGSVSRSVPLRPVMELKSVVSLVKTVPPRTSVSYGRRFTSERETVVATVPLGYADGYPRALSETGRLLVHGREARIIGRICMDQLMLDVTDIPGVKAGDVVTAFGGDGDAFLPVEDLASRLGTISYELVCGVSKRVPRVYAKDGKAGGCLDYLLR